MTDIAAVTGADVVVVERMAAHAGLVEPGAGDGIAGKAWLRCGCACGEAAAE